MQKLIVIRGPSGAGKSTVAQKLLDQTARPTLLVSEDKVRRFFSDWKRPAHEESKDLAIDSVMFGLGNGYDVIYEGILNIKTYKDRFEELIDQHNEENYFFYLDVSFDETLTRHSTRQQREEFGREEMELWWHYASPTGFANEVTIHEDSKAENTVALICEVADLVQ